MKNGLVEPRDDLFAKLSQAGEVTDSVTQIDIKELNPHHNHTYKVNDDAEMEELVESIKANGVISPILVRRYKDGYEIISGHRRHHASSLAGLNKVPCIVLDIDDDTSDIYMNQANKYRENILPSEKAWGYRVEFEARKRQGTLPQDLDVYDAMADNGTDSVSTIKRLIRLTYLNPKLLDKVDEGNQIKISQGVLLSKLSEKEQNAVLESLEESNKPLTLKHAEKLRDMHDSKKEINKDTIDKIIGNTFTPRNKAPKITDKDVSKYLPDTIRALDQERQIEYIRAALKKYSDYLVDHPEEINRFL